MFLVFNVVFLVFLCMCMLLPYLKIISETFSAAHAVDSGKVLFWPIDFTLDNYKAVLNDSSIVRAFSNSVFVTVLGTVFNLIMTSMLAYAVARPGFLYKKFVLTMVVISMIFVPPMIPKYLVIRELGLLDTFGALILPGAISSFNFFILKSFYQGIAGELFDAASIDGCSEFQTMLKIVMPVSKASLATIGLFYAVSHWNSLSGPLMYINNPKLITLQVKLNQIVQTVSVEGHDIDAALMSPTAIKMTSIIVTTIPIILVYPFLQKHFVKGATLGSVKE